MMPLVHFVSANGFDFLASVTLIDTSFDGGMCHSTEAAP